MDVFTIGLIILAATTIVFYIVLFGFIFYWHLKAVSYVVVPVIWTFEFLITGFFVVATVSIIIQYIPELIRIAGL